MTTGSRWRRVLRRLSFAAVILMVMAVATGMFVRSHLQETLGLPTPPPLDPFVRLFDATPTVVTITAGWQKLQVTVPRVQLQSDHTLWLRMHFEDWDRLADDVRDDGLARLVERFGPLAVDADRWRVMSAGDWDAVPQPITAMAAVGMIEYWVQRDAVGDAFELDAGEVLRTVKAIAMSESWFDHRALLVNRDGSTDVGLGAASGFARRTIRRWYASGWVDFTLTDDDYFNPWHASRALAFWFDLMLHEANGDLPLAIRAYNVGIGSALAGHGGDYLAGVERRRHRYFEGPSNSPTWSALSAFRRKAAGCASCAADP